MGKAQKKRKEAGWWWGGMKDKQHSGSRSTGLITLTLTGGPSESVECCKTNPYWKSSLVLPAERSTWPQPANVYVCVYVSLLNRSRPLETPKKERGR